MKTRQYKSPYGIFGGVFGAIADATGAARAIRPRGSPAGDGVGKDEHGHDAAPAGLGQRLMRWQIKGVAPHLDRASDVFERLDRWMWRQQNRQVESYLAGSSDVFELERRIHALERGPRGSVL